MSINTWPVSLFLFTGRIYNRVSNPQFPMSYLLLNLLELVSVSFCTNQSLMLSQVSWSRHSHLSELFLKSLTFLVTVIQYPNQINLKVYLSSQFKGSLPWRWKFGVGILGLLVTLQAKNERSDWWVLTLSSLYTQHSVPQNGITQCTWVFLL